jgi:hypothetical protein
MFNTATVFGVVELRDEVMRVVLRIHCAEAWR